VIYYRKSQQKVVGALFLTKAIAIKIPGL